MFNTLTKNKTKSLVENIFGQADVQINGSRPWDIQVLDERFYNRVLFDGILGFGESFMEKWWETKDLEELCYRLIITKAEDKARKSLKIILHATKSLFFNQQSLSKANEVAEKHYNLGNDLYTSFLDPYNQYTCGYFKDTDDLSTAQEAKLDLICRKLEIKSTDKVLDIGCGWGGFAKFASQKYGCQVTGISISDEQIAYARSFCAGLPVEIVKKDYRELTGSFDKVVSVGMLEHVGYKNYRKYMEIVKSCLKENGLFLLHCIGGNKSVKSVNAWIDKYIFPNGMAPSIQQLGESIEGLFVMEDWHNFGSYYEPTLLSWYENFKTNWDKIKEKYDEKFFRMFEFYFLSCAAAFKARDLELWQIILSPKGVRGGYKSIR